MSDIDFFRSVTSVGTWNRGGSNELSATFNTSALDKILSFLMPFGQRLPTEKTFDFSKLKKLSCDTYNALQDVREALTNSTRENIIRLRMKDPEQYELNAAEKVLERECLELNRIKGLIGDTLKNVEPV